MMPLLRFTLKEEHVKLLREAFVDWQNCETGAPEIDPKRPYGNSSVAHDVAEILGIDAGEEMSEDVENRLLALHRETDRALEVILRCGTFEPGEYVSDPYRHNWRRA